MTVALFKRLIVVPMKDPALSKTRLKSDLEDGQRETLARSLFQRTLTLLSELAQSPELDLLVVTASAEIRHTAERIGVQVLDEPQPGSLNGALEHAAHWAAAQGYDSLVVLPADLAMPESDELKQLCHHSLEHHQVVLCPAEDMGTNALLMALPSELPLSYGPRSFLKHFKTAEARGLNPMMLPLSSLKRDVDTSRDLALLLDHAPELSRHLRMP